MGNCDYIVAFYLGSRRSKYYQEMNEFDPYYLVKQHLKFLSTNPKNINKIYFVFNHDSELLPKRLINLINKSKVDVNIVVRENKDLSYGAWEEVLTNNVKGDIPKYAFLIEDDYLPQSKDFLQPFISKFKKDTGYVCQMLWKNSFIGTQHLKDPTEFNNVHASMSNGVISYDAIRVTLNQHNRLFHLYEEEPAEDYHIGCSNQVSFLWNLQSSGFQLDDIADICCLPFFNFDKNKTIMYGKQDGFIPIAPIIHHIELVPLTEGDLPMLLSIRNDASTRQFLENDSIFTLPQCKKWFSNLDSPWYVIKYLGKSVGYLRTTSNGEIGVDIHPKYRRKGIARRAFIEYLSRIDEASLWVFEDNFAKELYEKLGFISTGNFKVIRNRNYIKMEYRK